MHTATTTNANVFTFTTWGCGTAQTVTQNGLTVGTLRLEHGCAWLAYKGGSEKHFLGAASTWDAAQALCMARCA